MHAARGCCQRNLRKRVLSAKLKKEILEVCFLSLKRKQLSATRTCSNVRSCTGFLHLFRRGFSSAGYRLIDHSGCPWSPPGPIRTPPSRVLSPRPRLETSPRSPRPLSGQPGPTPHRSAAWRARGAEQRRVLRG